MPLLWHVRQRQPHPSTLASPTLHPGTAQHLVTAFLLLPNQVLLFHDQNYGIHYEYTIPVNYTAENGSEPEKQPDSLYIWTHSGWEGCSVQCGGGKAGWEQGVVVLCGVCPGRQERSRRCQNPGRK